MLEMKFLAVTIYKKYIIIKQKLLDGQVSEYSHQVEELSSVNKD